MTTQAIVNSALLNPSRGWFWTIWAALATCILVAVAALVDARREPHRDPTNVMAVYSRRTARRALARVGRLDLESSAAGAAAYRHLSDTGAWLRSERHHGSRRRQAAIAALWADVSAQMAALGYDPETGLPAAGPQMVHQHDGLPVPDRWAQNLETRPAPELVSRYRQALEAAGRDPEAVTARAPE